MKHLFVFLFFLVFLPAAFAQTTVTATVADPNGNPYANGTVSADSVVASGQASISTTPSALNGSGYFSVTLPAATYIFTICAPPTVIGPLANATPKQVCFNSPPIAVSGASMNITSQLSPAVLGPAISGANAGIPITTVSGLASVPGKINGTIAVVTNGASPTDCTVGGGSTLVTCQYNGSTWAAFAAVASPAGPPYSVQFNNGGAFGGIANPTGPGSALVSTSSSPVMQTKPTIDVRDGYGGSGGVDCTGSTDSTTVFQAMITNAPNFSKFIIPQNCVITLRGSPAITMDSRYGLEFEAAGRQTNSCDQSPGGAQFRYVQSYASGNTVFYLNRSQRLTFKNITIIANGTADIGWNVDQVGATPPINTSNLWIDNCVANASATQNPNFKGWQFSAISLSNVENMRIIRPYVECSSTLATTLTSNGTGIWFSTSANQKQEIVEQAVFQGCSVGVNSGQGSDNTEFTGLDSTSYSGEFLQGFNDAVWGKRYEYNQYPINIQAAIGPHLIEHSDFGATYQTPVTCPNGCGMVTMINNESDSPTAQWFTTVGTPVGSLIALNNRNSHFNTLQWPYGSLIVGATEIDSGSVTRNNVASFSYAQWLLTPSSALSGQSFPSPAVMLESTNGTYPTVNDFILQNVPAGIGTPTAETMVIGNYTDNSLLPQWIGYTGSFAGLNIAQAPTPTFGNSQVSNGGTPGSTTYSYQVVAVAGSGTTAASSVGTTTTGNNTLNSTNYNILYLASSAAAVSYNIYRTACGGTSALCTGGNATGLIANVPAYILQSQTPSTAYPFNDTGLSGNGTIPPSTNTTGNVAVAGNETVTGNFTIGGTGVPNEDTYTINTTSCSAGTAGISQLCVEPSGAGNPGDFQFVVNNGTAFDLQATLATKAALAGATFTGEVVTKASAAGGAGFNLPQGTAPTSPVNGDFWTTSGGVYARIAGSTVGPFGTGSGGGVPNPGANGIPVCTGTNCSTSQISPGPTFSSPHTYWVPFYDSIAAPNTSPQSLTAADPFLEAFYLHEPSTATTVTVLVMTGQSLATCDVGIYGPVVSGNTTMSLAWHTGSFACATSSTAVTQNVVSGPVTLQPGFYYEGVCSSTTSVTLGAQASSPGSYYALMGTDHLEGKDTTDTCTAGVLPSSVTIANIADTGEVAPSLLVTN